MKKENKIRVLMVEPGKHPQEHWLDNDLDSLQKAVSIDAPSQGLIAQRRRNIRNRDRFAVDLLVMHLHTHERTEEEYSESSLGHIGAALHWSPDEALSTIRRAADRGMVVRANGNVVLTDQGRHYVDRLIKIRRLAVEHT